MRKIMMCTHRGKQAKRAPTDVQQNNVNPCADVCVCVVVWICILQCEFRRSISGPGPLRRTSCLQYMCVVCSIITRSVVILYEIEESSSGFDEEKHIKKHLYLIVCILLLRVFIKFAISYSLQDLVSCPLCQWSVSGQGSVVCSGHHLVKPWEYFTTSTTYYYLSTAFDFIHLNQLIIYTTCSILLAFRPLLEKDRMTINVSCNF